MILPIFPLPIFLLPCGITQLRIFEQRYLTMVKNSQKTRGFVIAYQDKNHSLASWGSWVEIVDFDADDKGMLNINVQCKQLVSIDDAYRQEDGLLLAHVNDLPHWSQTDVSTNCDLLRQELINLFSSHDVLADLYQSPDFDEDAWVVARWIELLPLDFNSKAHFVNANSYETAVTFLSSVLSDK